MKLPLWHTRRPSLTLTAQEFADLRVSATVIEQDARGLKVLQLLNGEMLKIFRIKHAISSARVYSYARQFCRNAERLKALGIPTVEIRQLYHFADSNDSAVQYLPLPGKTLRQLAVSGVLDGSMMQQLGDFIAGLHLKGVYFRSLHMGNIVLNDAGEFGLIDIADMSIYPWKLGCGRRIRNFYHLLRIEDDLKLVDMALWQQMIDRYNACANAGESCQQTLLQSIVGRLAVIEQQA